MKEVGVLEAKTHLSALIDEVSTGAEVLITRHGKPVAKLVRSGLPRAPARDLVARTLALRAVIAMEDETDGPFDWKAAVNEGRP
jgi:antitoxin (DNA-binding transcriptional repressor) of toxin-antitoxin stability system